MMTRDLVNKKATARIEKLVSGGEGLARLDGKVVLIPYDLPGELVEFIIAQEKNQYFKGQVHRIIEPSVKRYPTVL